MIPSHRMPELVQELVAHHGNGLDAPGLNLALSLGAAQLIVEETVQAVDLRIAYVSFAMDSPPVTELEIRFFVDDGGRWIPYGIYRPSQGQCHYAELDLAQRKLTITDVVNQRALADYCEIWTFYLREQGWLEKGVVT